MKKLIALVALSTIVACNGSSNSSGRSSDKLTDNFPVLTQNTLSNQDKVRILDEVNQKLNREGLSIITNRSGKELNYGELQKGKVVFKNLSERETEIILKVDGDVVYTYSIEEDFAKKEKFVHVTIDEKRLDQEMLEANMSVSGNSLIVSQQQTHRYESADVSTIIRGEMDLLSPCNFIVNLGVNSFSFETETGRVTVPQFTSTFNSVCGKTFSKAELAQFDLSNILVCDLRIKDGGNCTTRDMRAILE